ncbi:MAG: restriction endonuclease [Candidatus Aenigmatarchaeota archaeon]
MQIEKILEELKHSREIDEVLAKYNWKDFESMVEYIFMQHDFSVKKNFRFKTTKRYEIDVLAEKEIIFCVECKRWERGRNKRATLLLSSNKHLERVEEFKKFANVKKHVIPMIITLRDEGFYFENKTFFIPIWFLNEFLLNESWHTSGELFK